MSTTSRRRSRQNEESLHDNFTLNLTKGNEAIKGDRARVARSSAERELRKIIDSIIDRQDKLMLERENLSDLSPRNTTSLIFAGDNFDGAKWAKRMSEIELELLNIDVELEATEALYDQWFTPVEKPVKSTASSRKKNNSTTETE
jgi:hypothetical protein